MEPLPPTAGRLYVLKFSQVTPPSITIAVLSGGDSSEREVSLASGRAIQDALQAVGHCCTAIDPATTDVNSVNWLDYDVAAIALHGRFGEDGQLQELLENKGIPFTGSDREASALAFSKAASKQQFITDSVPTPEFAVIRQTDSATHIAKHARTVGYPIVVKPDAEGSSFGISIVNSPDRLPAALAKCFQFGPVALIERAVPGTEWTVAVVDGRALPPICIETRRSFYDFRAKYEDDTTRYLFETEFESAIVEQIESVSLDACRSLGTQGVARVDVRLDPFNRPWVLEVNTSPGMTDHSLVPKAAARAGMSFVELCQRMIESGLKRCTSKKRKSA
jgi:D-alanine-D-alanine ligase